MYATGSLILQVFAAAAEVQRHKLGSKNSNALAICNKLIAL